MSKVKSRGTVLKVNISTVLTAVAQLESVSVSGRESETFPCTTLDSGVYMEYGATGYSEPGTVDFSGFLDEGLAPHAYIRDLLDAPDDTQAWQITKSDSNNEDIVSAGSSWEWSAEISDGVKFNCSLKLTGAPVYS